MFSEKSFYSDLDVEILDESRTIVPFGSFEQLHNDAEPCSIDRRKAFSKAGSDMFGSFMVIKLM